MAKYEIPQGYKAQAYKFALDHPLADSRVASHFGANRFAYNWMLFHIEEAIEQSKILTQLALRQGASQEEAKDWSKGVVGEIPRSAWDIRKYWNSRKDEVAPW
ncbi:transposase [mine drainage metagenome]|uniref:Transposase n=1 Tax=mine drainage metagenome TaxID=410659 RepID=T1B9I7_9ZZZZ